MIRLRHYRQDFAASCLAACVRMALSRWDISTGEAELRRILKIRSHVGGHPISLLNLRSLGVLSYVDSGTIEDLRTHVDDGEPVIVFLWTGELPYWEGIAGVDYLHAVVVVGLTESSVWYHDPSLDDGPIEIPIDVFLQTWRMSDSLLCVLRSTTADGNGELPPD